MVEATVQDREVLLDVRDNVAYDGPLVAEVPSAAGQAKRLPMENYEQLQAEYWQFVVGREVATERMRAEHAQMKLTIHELQRQLRVTEDAGYGEEHF